MNRIPIDFVILYLVITKVKNLKYYLTWYGEWINREMEENLEYMDETKENIYI